MDTRDIYAYTPGGLRWFDKLFMRCFPKLFMRWVVWRKGIKTNPFRIDRLLRKAERIDFELRKPGSRGLILVIDKEVALYFYQRGPHFIYDGWEAGEYSDGDVTIFDIVSWKEMLKQRVQDS